MQDNIANNPLAELRLWQLISPTLPVGAYAYSQGLEYAIDSGWISDRRTCESWICGQMRCNLCHLDIPLLLRLYQACADDDKDKFEYWNQYLLSSRETQELLDEDRQLGVALRRLLIDLSLGIDETLLGGKDNNSLQAISFAAAFCVAALHWQIPGKQAARGYLWAWCENQVAAAVKLIPLGQTDGQKMLIQLAERIPNLVEQSGLVSDDDIGSLSYGVAIASALHESQYTRLFRS